MRGQLLEYLRCPVSGAPFELFPFEAAAGPDGDDVKYGVLRSQQGGHLYPVLRGVPSLLPDSFPPEFLTRFADRIAASVGPVPETATRQANIKWSFSAEWETFFNQDLSDTWGWTVEERLAMCLQETQLEPDDFRGALVCDAGCGNGLLTEAIASLGATVIGLDYSTSVFHAERRRRSANVHFVRGDLLSAPLARGAFDVIVSNGVLHHTPSTRAAFEGVADLVKPDGVLYVWLYRRSRELKVRALRMRETVVRPVLVRLPRFAQEAAVRVDAALLWLLTKALARRKDLTYRDLLISSYDSLTPRYVWMHHTPMEVACWFFEKGFSAPALTHWDNPGGFGMVARKRPVPDTPGLNFRRKDRVRRRYL